MLRIGSRSYDLVRAHSGFFLWHGLQRHVEHLQRWRMEFHYVPSDQDPGRPDATWEYLRLSMHPHDYCLADWRDLTGFRSRSFNEELNPLLNWTSLENLLSKSWFHKEELDNPCPENLTIRWNEGYLFTCELDGFLRRSDDAEEEDFHLLDQIPFAEATVEVPINAADPVATARAILAREIKLSECASSRITPHDWRREKDPNAQLSPSHHVSILTPWRQQLA